MKPLKLLVAAINVLAAVLVSLLGAGAWLVGSEGGSARAVAFAAARFPEALSIGRIEGTLAGGLVLHDVELRLGADVVAIERLALSWRLGDLLAGAAGFDEVEVSKASYVRGERTGEAEPRAIETPLPIVVRGARLGELAIVSGDSRLLVTDAVLDGRWIGERVTLEHVAARGAGFDVSGKAAIELAERVGLSAELSWAGDVDGQRFAGVSSLTGTLPELQLESRASLPFPVAVTGRVELGGTPRFDLDFEWTRFAWPGVDVVTSPSGALAISGTQEGFDFVARGALVAMDERAELAVSGRGRGLDVDVERFALDTAYGTLRGAGSVDLGSRHWDLAVESDDVDSGARWSDWRGRGRVSGRLQGRLRPALEWSVTSVAVEGVVGEHPITASGAVSYRAASGYTLDRVRVASAGSVVRVDGAAGERLDLDVSADVRELGVFLPGAAGRVTADLAIRGARTDPRIEGTAMAVAAAFRGYRVGRARLESRLGVGAGSPLELNVEASDVLEGRYALDSLVLNAAGTVLDHRLTVEAAASQWNGRATAEGGFRDGLWRGRLATLELSPVRLGRWSLQAPAVLGLGRGRAELSPACLAQAASRVCATLDVEGAPDDRLAFGAERFDLAVLAPFLPAGVALSGVYDLDASLTGLRGAPSGSLSLRGQTTHIELGARPQDRFATDIDAVALDAELERGRLTLRSTLAGRETGNLELDAVVDDVRVADSRVRGRLAAEWPDLGFLAMLSPNVGRVGGRLAADLSLGGTLDAPAVGGKADWSEGSVSVPDWGLLVEHIDGEATSADGSALEYRASGRVGDGSLTLAGVTQLDAEARFPTRLTLTGNAVRAVQLPQAEIFAQPELTARVSLPDIYVDGSVRVPRANITLETLPAQAVAPSSDAVVHGAAELEEPHPLHLHSNIRIVLGDDVAYAGANLAATLTGQLQLAYDTGRSATAAGRLNVAGAYTAYGQTLKLDRGELLFNGPIDDPTLDVRAVRTISTTTVGVQLSGTLRSPETRLFSTPAMSEADALSYLLLGRPLRGTGRAEETATLQTAAISMGLQQALPVVQRIGETLGLDELTVESTDTDAGALMAGKYLSPKVYIRYSYGLFNRIGGLLLRLKVNDRLSIETRSGDEKSMDLLYTVEKK